MRKSTKAFGLIFLAAASVYSGQVIGAAPGKHGKADPKDTKNTDVKLLEEPSDVSSPATQPSDGPATQPATQPSNGSSNVAGQVLSPAMQTNPDGTFSLNITNGADLGETLRVIGFQAQKSVLPSKEVHSVLPALDLYNVTVHEALDAILKVNGFVYKEQGNFIYVYSVKEAAEMEKANRVTSTEVFRLYYTPAGNAMNMLKPMLSEAGQMSVTTPATSGLASGTGDVGGNSHATDDLIVITDYTDNLDRIRKVLKEIDRRPQQIMIEATILRAALTENNALGVDFNILSGVDFTTLSSSSGQITNANIGSSSLSGNNNSSIGTGNNFTQPISGGLKVAFLNDNVSIFVAALEGVTDTTVLANPKVLALNKQKGEVIVGRKDGYLTTTTTDTSTVQTVDFLDTGTRLVFRPYIGDDGYVRMEIHPEDSSGGLSAANLPFKITTEVTSNIMVKDGRTVVIGGLFREASTTARSQIPGIGNIPVAGALFRNQSDQTQREEIIILLTPHIVKDDAAFSQASEELLKWGDQMRVGVRKGMMWWGRERLAESCYERAVAEMSKSEPNKSMAIWHLDCATNLNPTFSEAIQMKQELTGKVISTCDNSAIRGFVRRQIMAERNAAGAGADTSLMEGEPATQPSTQPTKLVDAAAMVPAMEDVPATQPSTQPTMLVDTTPMAPAMEFDPATLPPMQPTMVVDTTPMAPAMEFDPATLPPMEPMNLVDSAAMVPATQPMSDELTLMQTPTTEPSTQPSMASMPEMDEMGAKETGQWGMGSMFWGMRGMFMLSSKHEGMAVASPSTQPSTQPSHGQTTITELPSEEENK